MYILTVNCGSSSIKLSIIDTVKGICVCQAVESSLANADLAAFKDSLRSVLSNFLQKHKYEIAAVAHRVVHGGETYTAATKITDNVITEIAKLNKLAPLHNPFNLLGVEVAQNRLAGLPQFAVFDTAFHTTIPEVTARYALPIRLVSQYQLRKYGFHGTSHAYIARKLAQKHGSDNYKAISCHLGGGCSVTAIDQGKSVYCSMGFTPLSGVTMATRSGDIDPGLLLYLIDMGMTTEEIKDVLWHESGWYGLSGVSPDLRDVIEVAEDSDDNQQSQSKFALAHFVRSVAQEIAKAAVALEDSCDYVVFTGGVGEGSQMLRERIMQEVWFAAMIPGMKTVVIPTNEGLEMALQTQELL